ncbi:cytochrome C oxidase subunit II [Tumebacillus algifaecis]|uniref:Cytochrome aa3 subunit 2 n=1 Tax=Tumebacillus algifaecis TaxID=1214604 RepID=A0A223CY90_9BACL|nr:cytochrome c oxidase subunit II [Tumebacillus algifaecis]ASS74127.1 cytochrome C oxidase subunit II [Tumebacillus algifaecis]
MHLHKFEKIWLIFGGVTLVAFIIVLAINAFSHGHHPPSDLNRVVPAMVDQTAPFDQPGLVKKGENKYDLNMPSFAFGYAPAEQVIPLGAEVTFRTTSKDVIHGFAIPGTNVNMMVVPGHVNTATTTFTKAGEYMVICNEYCGAGHHMMMAKLVVK